MCDFYLQAKMDFSICDHKVGFPNTVTIVLIQVDTNRFSMVHRFIATLCVMV